MNPSSAMALVSAGLMSAARTVVSTSPAASAAERRFKLRVVFIIGYFRWLIGWLISFRFLRRWRGPLTINCFFFRPVEAHDHGEWPLWRGQPVGFLVLAGRFVLDNQRQSAVGIAFELRQHR